MSEPTVTSDGVLAERIRAGDRAALAELYDRYAPLALATAARILSDRQLAEDVVHDGFVAVWQKIGRYEPARGSLRSWLLTVVRNRAIDRLRAGRPSVELAGADDPSLAGGGPNPTWEAVVERLSAREIRAAIDALPGEQRQAILLAYFGGHSYREIAALTGVPLGTANGRLRLGLAKLRDALTAGVAGPVREAERPDAADTAAETPAVSE